MDVLLHAYTLTRSKLIPIQPPGPEIVVNNTVPSIDKSESVECFPPFLTHQSNSVSPYYAISLGIEIHKSGHDQNSTDSTGRAHQFAQDGGGAEVSVAQGGESLHCVPHTLGDRAETGALLAVL